MSKYLIITISIFVLITKVIASTTGESFVNSNKKFTAKFYNELIKDPDLQGKSFIFSPYSIQLAAAVQCVLDTEDETVSKIIQGFNLPSTEANVIADTYQSFANQYVKDSLFKIVNKVFVAKDYILAPSFHEIVIKKFHLNAEVVDFEKKKETALIINHWIETNTEGKIKNIIEELSLNDVAKILFTNAIYFKGHWKEKFDPKNSFIDEFFLGFDDKTTKVEYMTGTKEMYFKIDFDSKLIILDIPLRYNNLSLAIFAANEYFIETSKTLDHINNLNLYNLIVENSSFNDMWYDEKAYITMPKLKVEQSWDLNRVLKNLGTTSSAENANITNLLERNKLLNHFKMVHKVVIDIAEDGGELIKTKTDRMLPFVINLNRPFLYLIKGGQGEIYFMGRYTGM